VPLEGNALRTWRYFEAGPKDSVPIVMLPGAAGTAEVFYRQIMSLCPKGYRIVSVQPPAFNSYQRFLKAFDKFIDVLNSSKVHLFGTALGGYLAQCYAQYRPTRVLSLVLCNSFSDTQYYADNNSLIGLFSVTPAFILKRILLANFPSYETEREIANSVDFMVAQLESVSQEDVASRLTLNCTQGPLNAVDLPLDDKFITVIDCVDDVSLPPKLREEVFKVYPNARQALLKSGGNFPYLSRPSEVNMHLEVHLRILGYLTTPAVPINSKKEEDDNVEDDDSEDDNNNNENTTTTTTATTTSSTTTTTTTTSSTTTTTTTTTTSSTTTTTPTAD